MFGRIFHIYYVAFRFARAIFYYHNLALGCAAKQGRKVLLFDH